MIYVPTFDTNILYSGMWWRGAPHLCLQLARSGQVVPVTCAEILAEFEAKILQKRKLSAADAAAIIADVRGFSNVVQITNRLVGAAPDPDDDKILECALVGGATHIVTGDRRHLLPLGNFQGIPIVTAADFLALLAVP